MRITGKQLRQIIKEELAGDSGASTREITEDLGVSEDKMFNVSMTVQGLTKPEYAAVKDGADTSLGDASFFVVDNTSEQPAQVILADFGKSEGVKLPLEIGANSRSNLIGFSKEALNRTPPRSARIIFTGTHNAEDFIRSVDYTTHKLVRSSVSETLADRDYVAVLIKLRLGTTRVETPQVASREEPAAALTKISDIVTPEFVDLVTKRPLRRGSKGENVRIAQRAVKAAIQRFIDVKANSQISETDIPSTLSAEIRQFVPDIPSDASARQMLISLIAALKDDGDYGNITKTAVKVYQHLVDISIDGSVGEQTAKKLQGINMSINLNESAMIINRWSRLAGLLID